MFSFKALLDWPRAYKLVNGTGHGGHGWEFPEAIREMDMIVVEHGKFRAADHKRRVEVLLALSCAFERENPDVDTFAIPPQSWAMAIFIYCNGRMNEKNFSSASSAAAWYGVKHKLSDAEINWSTDWASERLGLDRLMGKKAE